MSPEAMLTIKDVMERLQLSRATIYRLIDQGKLSPRKIGKSVRFREEEIDAFIRGGDGAPAASGPSQEAANGQPA